MDAIVKTDFCFPGQKSVYKGKVRDVYDINDEYLKQLDKIIRHAKDAFASVTVNISDGSCIMANSRIASLELKDVNEPLDSYIERISQSIPQREERTQYRRVFCVDNVRGCLAQGKDLIP